MHRLRVRVPFIYVQRTRKTYGDYGQKALVRDVQARVAGLTRSTAHSAIQDPTDDTNFAVLCDGACPPGSTDGTVTVLASEPIAPPAVLSEKETAPALDSGLAPDEAAAVAYALLHDTDPRHVGAGGLPAVLEPYYPASASLLRAKGALLEAGVPMNAQASKALLEAALADEGDAALDKVRAEFEAWARQQPLPLAVLRDDVRKYVLAGIQYHAVMNVPGPVMRLGNALFRPITFAGHTVYIVPPKRATRGLPAMFEDGFVSPPSLQQALGQQKPTWSGVGNVSGLGRNQALVGQVGGVRGERIRHQMARASKAIDRRRWVEWYRHYRRLNTLAL